MSGPTPLELDSQSRVVHAPVFEAFLSIEPLFDFVDSCLGAEGEVYYTLNTKVVKGWGSRLETVVEPLKQPAGMVFSDDHLFLAENRGGRILRLDPQGRSQVVREGLDSPLDLGQHPELGLIVLEGAGRLSNDSKVLLEGLEQPKALVVLGDGRVAILESDRIRLWDPSDSTQRFCPLPPGSTRTQAVLGGLEWDPVRNQLHVSLPGIGEIRTVPLWD